ncbi:MAG: copper resistance protein CopC [Sinomonas sp.]|nr:copper resistance protein CopC [Sinomonas sp.]
MTATVSTARLCASRLVARAAAALGLAAALIAPAAAAHAHDSLESTNPANGSTVATVPAAVVLTFDHTPIAIGTKITVKDASGTDQSAGDATVVDNQVTQAIKPGAPAGAYTVVWRVVSSDAHPIEGTLVFNAQAPAGSSSRTASTPTTAAGAAPSSSSPAGPTGPAEAVGAGVPPWLIVGGLLVLAIVAALVYFVRRGLTGVDPED